MAVRLPALGTGRALLPRNIIVLLLVLISVAATTVYTLLCSVRGIVHCVAPDCLCRPVALIAQLHSHSCKIKGKTNLSLNSAFQMYTLVLDYWSPRSQWDNRLLGGKAPESSHDKA
jgi:hypothetical protein